MNTLERRHGAFSFVSSFAVTHAKLGGNLAAFTLVLLTSLAVGAAPAVAADCASLAGLALKDTTITSATIVPAAGMLPEYCKVLGSIHNLPQSTILFEVSLPTTKWNGKYFVAGGGGYNGVIPRLTQALMEGYAAAGSDTGHEAKNANWAANNLDAQNNYAYLATHVVTLVGKQILRTFYNQHERRSYFVGCSNGGKRFRRGHLRRPSDRSDQTHDAICLERAGPGVRPDSAGKNSRDRKGHHERVPRKRRSNQRRAYDSRPLQV